MTLEIAIVEGSAPSSGSSSRSVESASATIRRRPVARCRSTRRALEGVRAARGQPNADALATIRETFDETEPLLGKRSETPRRSRKVPGRYTRTPHGYAPSTASHSYH
jgi:hypothetical protein